MNQQSPKQVTGIQSIKNNNVLITQEFRKS